MGSTNVVKQLSFSMLPSILTFDFDAGVLMGYFWGWGKVQKLFWGLLI